MEETIRDNAYSDIRGMLECCLCELQERAKNLNLPGISSGFEPLDNIIGGFEDGKVYVIGGKPGMGKEELMLSMILDIIMQSKRSVLMFSTNNRQEDYVERLLFIQCGIPSSHQYKGLLEPQEWDRLDKEVFGVADAPLFIHDSWDLPLNELVETARNSIRGQRMKIIFIDCLQMIDFFNDDENISERMAKVMYSLKQLARLLRVPIVVGAMLSRGVERREETKGKQPLLSDLACSSYIEELADVVMIAYRPEYYRIRGRDLHEKIGVFVKKNGLKPLDNILLEYHQDTGVLSFGKKTIKSESKAAGLKELKTHNKAIKNLIETFKLEEDMPF